ncbi:MAG TPA: ABC transporter substrate-binding protein [Candidatus Limnocylindrales bacterium]
MSLRTRRGLALAASLAFVISACSPGASQTPAASEGGESAAPSASAEAASDNFKFAVDGEPTYFSLAYTDLPTSWIVGLLYNGLYRINDALEVVPDIAAEAPVQSADGLTWTVKLRDDIKWHDGTPVTAEDAKFTFDLALSPNCTYIPDFCSSIGDNVESVTVVDPTTVELKLKQKFAPFLIQLASPLMPKAAVEASYAKFAAAAASVDAAAVKALADKISTAVAAEACASDAPPAECSPDTYTAEVEPLLTSAGITLPNKAAYTVDGALDAAAYGQALIDQLNDLNTTLGAAETDKIAAAFRLLDFQRNPVGTGPYMFSQYNAGQDVQLAKNPNYHSVAVGPENVFIPIIKDAATASAALQKGDINWQTEVTSDALSTLVADSNLALSEFPDFGYYYIGFNLREGRLYADKALRQAFSMCIDHKQTVQVATEGNGIPAKANVPPASWAYSTDVPDYVHDPAAAKVLIEGAGWTLGADGIYEKDGVRLSSDLYVRQGRPQRVRFGQLAKDQLKECGIEINVKEADFATVLLPLLSYPNNFDTYLGGWSTSIDPDDYSIFHSSSCTTQENPDDNNFVCWNNPEGDRLLEEGRQELDQEKRKAIYAEFQKVIHDDLPYYFTWADLAHRGYTKSVDASEGEINFSSPLDYWNNDTWVVNSAR